MDGAGEEFEIDAQIPTYPNKQLHVGGLKDEKIRKDALDRLQKNGVSIQNNFFGCLHAMSIETADTWNYRQVREKDFML